MMKKLALFLLFMSGLSYGQATSNLVGVQIVGFGTNTSIHAAVAAATASGPGGTVFIPCGNYSDNLDITIQVSIIGENEQCVLVTPANPTLPVIAIDAQHVPVVFRVVLRDFSLQCPLNTTCADGILIEGNGTNQPNDSHYIRNVDISSATPGTSSTFGFLNGLDIIGRTIDTTVDNLFVGNTRNNGLNIINSFGPVNNLFVLNSSFHNNWNYGMYLNQNGISTASTDLTFLNDTFQDDGVNTSLTDCAGVYINTIGGITFRNSYFESNCAGNLTPAKIAHIRATATFAQAVNVRENLFNSPNNEWSVYDDATQTTGMWDGNYTIAIGRGFNIATSNAASAIFLGTNFNFPAATITPDRSGQTHVASPTFSGTFTTTAATSESVTLAGCTSVSHAWVEPTNSTAAAMTGVFVSSPTTNGFTLNHSATSGGTFNTFCTIH